MKSNENKMKKLYYVKDGLEYLFIPIINTSDDTSLFLSKKYLYEKLPYMIYGKYLHNYIGYNPNGWWKYINIKKDQLLYK